MRITKDHPRKQKKSNEDYQEGSRVITFLVTRVNRNINYIFGILTLRAIDWYINELILRWSKEGRVEELWGVFAGPLSRNIKCVFGIFSSSPVDWHPCWVIWLKGGSRCLVVETHGMPPSRLRGYVQANYQQRIPNLQFTYCVKQKLHVWSKKVRWQRFWLDSCIKQVVSARACAYQFLPYNSSGFELFGRGTGR